MAYAEADEVKEFETHAAKAFFASAWADAAEESGNSSLIGGADILNVMPNDIDPSALHAARTLRIDIERINGKSISDLMAVVESEGCGDRPNTIEYFGHYSAMQSMGHGVGLRDAFGDAVAQAIRIDYCEFGSHSLSKDYF